MAHRLTSIGSGLPRPAACVRGHKEGCIVRCCKTTTATGPVTPCSGPAKSTRKGWSLPAKRQPLSLCPRRGQRGEGAKEGGATGRSNSAAKGIIEAEVLHLTSLQRGSLILREDCYNVVTPAPTVGNDSVVPDSKRERGVHARYALLGTRSAGGGRRPGDRLGAVPIGPPLVALAASRGPGWTTLPGP
jgi:hypothetical protein